MIDTRKEQERDELHRAIWSIADDLRGSVDGWDFKNYVLGTMFYRYISENFSEYIDKGEHEAGNTDFRYALMSDAEAEEARSGLVEEKGFFIAPSELFCNVCKNAPLNENLNETLEKVFMHIEDAYNGRIAGKQKVRRDENNFKEFIENWNYPFGRYDERGWESLQDWFPYSYVNCYSDDEDKDINTFKKLQRDVDDFLRDNGFLRRINHDEYNIILEALNTIIQSYPSRGLPKNLRKPSKRLTSLLKNFNYDVKHGMHGVYYEIIKIEEEET